MRIYLIAPGHTDAGLMDPDIVSRVELPSVDTMLGPLRAEVRGAPCPA